MNKYFVENNFEYIYLRVLEEINKRPEFSLVSKGKESKEIVNLSFELTNPYDRMIWNKARATNYEFAMRFFIWTINGCSDYEYVGGVNKNAQNYIDTSKTQKYSTAYGPRIVRQMEAVIEELNRDLGTRRAVISILEERDLDMLGTDTKEEFPCTESLQFLVRDNKLHCHVKMRSNNMVTTLVYDVFNFTLLQEYVLKRLKTSHYTLAMGNYYHNCGSAHFFAEQQDLVDRILACKEPALIRK